ncbi:trifunctional transcriptional regulator/proline dehydrogenase/L-glutamate gamma-semialdehyde dehydrogenase [Azospirillum rugosum]|uniref:Bifunctional protein PutA n=1 Tax=Azospirillum rugosum TaxID=416170 RepID=A0ABS4SVU3_9PROT|nr:trifunctional transcriptional regulator/proline dehydrogenase/L-glutamate gamma-semialdehyde dehydrogenase [Azospirillum rugosum]MBP2295510.1 RHH-type proline utilization regulon transcriptional repressor/proline dehydrogenase/delta 1-pyrroline-5-carboxylate dehydrogenase [Azospirillum rugosum]MDQ0528389.1 RHH-type proline utilization regulon transcriptional repressor/proline dehydrogenase/delta 1-pyrroline-5-carboxylate dehydrogenase [Azospirillum rugosum]
MTSMTTPSQTTTSTSGAEAGTPIAGSPPFSLFAPPIRPASELRAAITAAYRRPEGECLPFLLEQATLPPAVAKAARETARTLITALRAKPPGRGVEGLIHEYSLSSQEGLALMCLAEALLRIPDAGTRDALIRDKLSGGDWQAHLGNSPSLFVNAATWGLLITGRLTASVDEPALSSALTRMLAKGGEPLIRRGVDFAMRMMGEQFVTGQTIQEALANSRKMEAEGFRYSYDMLGEAAMTAADADRYYADYERAIHAIGKASAGRGVYQGPGISIKLSAIHPRYSRAQADRVMGELLPRVKELALLAKGYDIGLNIDAEEADRLELSLDLMESLCFDPDLAGWNGIGFVVQAYGKRCPYVIDFLIDLARRSGHRLMVRLVKGAYWDAEIKRAQLDGLDDFPVYTRKVYTDVSYVACARKLLGAPDAVFPQFATHNAQTLATIYELAGPDFQVGKYEFQCLHGMGEPLYSEVVGPLKRPCRIYAPVGTHETLLAYLVRRLLENGANSSFVNRIADKAVPVEELVADPVEVARAIQPLGAPHALIANPRDLYAPERANSAGLDLSNEQELTRLGAALTASADVAWTAAPLLADGERSGEARPVLNPADRRDVVGSVIEATPEVVEAAFRHAEAAAPAWAATPPAERAACLFRAADALQARMPTLLGLIVREAGKSLPNAIAEVREAVDFLRYYGAQVRDRFDNDSHRPVGPVVCISPWNFPLAIFAGQVAAALAAGNPVLAKPAEETPLIAAEAVRILREAGIPDGVVQLLPGAGEVGAALVGNAGTRAVMFTGSTEVARLIRKQLAGRLSPNGAPIPLIAETGGQNAMIVDSSALAEQVVGDVLASAFDSAGQRCSALRVLCLQEDVADRMLAMLKGAMAELRVGNPDRLATDVGPVITEEAKANIERHIAAMRAKGRRVEALPLPAEAAHGTFVPPTLIEIGGIAELEREVFGPVLHVVRFRRDDLDRLVDAINATGYGLTFGLHTRIDATIERVTERIAVGNVYVNRNTIGAVVGVQPFGGHGLSGTGPKAGGPLYLTRLLSQRPKAVLEARGSDADLAPARAYGDWLRNQGRTAEAKRCADQSARSALGASVELVGPVGERNVYELHRRGRILLLPQTETGLLLQLGAVFATGNDAVVDASADVAGVLRGLPAALARRVTVSGDWTAAGPLAAALVEGDGDRVIAANRRLAELPGPIVLAQSASVEGLRSGAEDYVLDWLLNERSVSVNTAAAGGNASLVAMS